MVHTLVRLFRVASRRCAWEGGREGYGRIHQRVELGAAIRRTRVAEPESVTQLVCCYGLRYVRGPLRL